MRISEPTPGPHKVGDIHHYVMPNKTELIDAAISSLGDNRTDTELSVARVAAGDMYRIMCDILFKDAYLSDGDPVYVNEVTEDGAVLKTSREDPLSDAAGMVETVEVRGGIL